jgi:hypothetical protein
MVVVAAACSTNPSTVVPRDEGEAPSCPARIPNATGHIGDALVTMTFDGDHYTTTFTHLGTTYTSSGDVSYPASNLLALQVMSSAGIDTECIAQPVIYSFAWSDDCSLVGLTRDNEHCDTRVNNLEGVTLAVQK